MALSAMLLPATAAVGVCLGGWIEAISRSNTDLELGFTIRGRVMEVLARPGDRVEAGAPLVRLDDREAASHVELAAVRAASTVEVDIAEAEWRLAQNEEQRLREAMSRAGAAPFEVERAALETRRQELRLLMARQRQAEARIVLGQSELQRERFSLSAPAAGVVEDVRIEPGELVEELKPVVRLVGVDPLRIDVAAPVDVAATLAVGDEAWVRFRDSGDESPATGRIVHISAVADPASDTRIVRVEARNPTGRPAGSRVEVLFVPPGEPREPVAAPATGLQRHGRF